MEHSVPWTGDVNSFSLPSRWKIEDKLHWFYASEAYKKLSDTAQVFSPFHINYFFEDLGKDS